MTDHYFTDDPSVPSDPGQVTLALPGLALDLRTDRGVFSRDRVDPGTRFLLSDGPPPTRPPGRILDLGCGYGPIACALACRWPEATVWAIDTNERARALCAGNADRLGLTNVRVSAPDELDAAITFDLLWSNPPIRIGKPALHDLLTRWLTRLTPEGEATLVVQKHLGSDSLQRWLQQQGWQAERVGSRQGYRLLRVRRAGAHT
ncbi:MAG: class I SAM-dependent methyltransferase [Acidimicrobiia bacterium]|nr:class I SAM-dependent methyltransferase [Acidimicrobiia bacterium]